MGTVNFSVPDDVKKAFNKAFAGENKSAILARLMQQAVAEHERQKRRAAAVAALLKLRTHASPASAVAIRKARHRGRP